MKRVLMVVMIVMLVMTMGAGTADAKHKVKKAKAQAACPVCDGHDENCVYWCGSCHMTPHEIQDFEILEMGYTPDGMKQKGKNQLTPWFKVKK